MGYDFILQAQRCLLHHSATKHKYELMVELAQENQRLETDPHQIPLCPPQTRHLWLNQDLHGERLLTKSHSHGTAKILLKMFCTLQHNTHTKVTTTYRSLHDVKISSIKCTSFSCIATLKACGYWLKRLKRRKDACSSVVFSGSGTYGTQLK